MTRKSNRQLRNEENEREGRKMKPEEIQRLMTAAFLRAILIKQGEINIPFDLFKQAEASTQDYEVEIGEDGQSYNIRLVGGKND